MSSHLLSAAALLQNWTFVTPEYSGTSIWRSAKGSLYRKPHYNEVINYTPLSRGINN